ncbi:hypothetical protein TYRP_006249 [Tyrophagus putrescentiae]|nr:hypothetical protein TYRP_006249 [Tyrophagus putrescentiae]
MKSFTLVSLVGCLLLVSSAHAWFGSKKAACPIEPSTCFHWKSSSDVRNQICQKSNFVAEVEISKAECGTIKLKSVFSSAGHAYLTDATIKLSVAVRADCDTKNLFNSGSGSFCVVAHPSVMVSQTFILDDRASLIPGFCDFSVCSGIGSGSGSFRQASSSGGDNSTDDADSETTTPKPDEPEKKKRKQQKSSIGGMERSVNDISKLTK